MKNNITYFTKFKFKVNKITIGNQKQNKIRIGSNKNKWKFYKNKRLIIKTSKKRNQS